MPDARTRGKAGPPEFTGTDKLAKQECFLFLKFAQAMAEFNEFKPTSDEPGERVRKIYEGK